MPKILMPYTVHLDHTLRVTPVSTLFYKGDSNAHRFELNVLSKGLQADLSGCTAVYRFYRLQDSTVVSNPASIEGGKVVAVLDKACYDYIGRFALTIAIQNGEDETTVFYGDGYMSGNRADTGITGDYVVYDVETLLAKIAEIDTAIANANTAIANANTATENANAAEAARADAEAERVAAENYRVGHESTRQMHENDREQHEKTRISSETTRRNAETERAAAETARIDAETARAEAEQQRAAAEEARDAAETDRESAEQARAAAEQARQETFAGYEERLVAATPDDTTVGSRAWSSKKTVDSLCMPLKATGNPVQVYPVEGYPLGVKVSWEPTQEGSGVPSPDNIRPITGKNAISVTRCRKNLFENKNKSKTINGITFAVNPDGSVTVNGTATEQATFDYARNGVIYPNAAYKITGCPAGGSDSTYSLVVFDGSSTVIGKVYGNNAVNYNGEAEIWARIVIRAGSTVTNIVFKPQLELGSTATPYEPYTGSTTDIALPETVYGGTLDVETGVVTVDRALITLDRSKLILRTNTVNGKAFYEMMNMNLFYPAPAGNQAYVDANTRCNVARIVEPYGGGEESEYLIYVLGDNRIRTSVALYDSDADIKICYPIKDPYTIQLTPQQITALSGTNTIYSDAGTLTVTGREDPRHTIVTLTDRIAALESAAAGV